MERQQQYPATIRPARVDTSASGRAPTSTDSVARGGGGLGSITEVVRLPNDRSVSGAAVAILPADSTRPARARLTTTNEQGQFTVDSLPYGEYQISVIYPGAKPFTVPLTIAGAHSGTMVVPGPVTYRPSNAQTAATVLCLVLYFFTFVLARWNHIAEAVHAMIDRQLTALETRLQTEVEFNERNRKRVAVLKGTVGTLKKAQEERRRKLPRWYNLRRAVPEFFFWSQGAENATWVAIHEVERQLAAFVAPPEYVDANLRSYVAELQAIKTPVAITISKAISDSLDPNEPVTAEAVAPRATMRKALLGRAIAIVYEDRDKNFSSLMEWQNKASWLMLVAIIFIAFIAGSLGRAELFLAGATGGFVSRLMRALRSEDVPLDYGASWTTLFLSPLFGALAGWFGVALITLAADPRSRLLGSAFDIVDWNTPGAAPTLAVAFMLGFSERLFDSITGAVEKHAREAEARLAPPPGTAGSLPAMKPNVDGARAGGERTATKPGTVGTGANQDGDGAAPSHQTASTPTAGTPGVPIRSP